MNKLATIVPVFGIGALNSGLALIDDNASNVKSLFVTEERIVQVGVVCPSRKKTMDTRPINSILSLVGFSALK